MDNHNVGSNLGDVVLVYNSNKPLAHSKVNWKSGLVLKELNRETQLQRE